MILTFIVHMGYILDQGRFSGYNVGIVASTMRWVADAMIEVDIAIVNDLRLKA